MEARNLKIVMDTVESCLKTVRHRLAVAVERTLRPMMEDEVSELKLVFLTLVSALSSLDAEVSGVLLLEAGRSEDFFSRVRELEAGLDLPREVLDRAAKFAVDLQRSGMFTVPQELHRCLAQLLSGEETGGSKDLSHDQVISRACQTEQPPKMSTSACQTEESQTSGAAKVTSAASQAEVLVVPRVTRADVQRQLWEGVYEDDGLKIEGAVLSGADLEKVRDFWTPLTVAASEGHVEAVRALLRLGAGVDGKCDWVQCTALNFASMHGHEAVVRELLAAGASVGAKDEVGSTALHEASMVGQEAVVRELVAAGADLNPRNRWGYTPLGLAVDRGRTAVAAYLRSVGATR